MSEVKRTPQFCSTIETLRRFYFLHTFVMSLFRPFVQRTKDPLFKEQSLKDVFDTLFLCFYFVKVS